MDALPQGGALGTDDHGWIAGVSYPGVFPILISLSFTLWAPALQKCQAPGAGPSPEAALPREEPSGTRGKRRQRRKASGIHRPCP